MTLHFIIACYNRREVTRSCLESLFSAIDEAKINASVTVFDDGSTDGTSEMIRETYPNVTMLYGSGDAYWATSMASAERHVLSSNSTQPDDYIVWLNDDVLLDADSLLRIKELRTESESAILVLAVREPATGKISYSGMNRSGIHPLRLSLVEPSEPMKRIDTFNGNFVVVPMKTARSMGGIDGGFAHALADIDYGLRANRKKIPVLLAKGSFGTCARNVDSTNRTILQAWRDFVGRKGGGHLMSQIRILRRTNPIIWPFILSGTYVLWWLRNSLKLVPFTRGTK